MHLQHFLSNNEAKDIVQAIARRVPRNANPEEVFDFVINNDLKDGASNLSMALRILLTLPVPVAWGERSFSKFKLIKTYIRSTMTQRKVSRTGHSSS